MNNPPNPPPTERGAGLLPGDAFDVRCRACRVPIGDDVARRVVGARRLADGRMELLASGRVVVHRCEEQPYIGASCAHGAHDECPRSWLAAAGYSLGPAGCRCACHDD